MDILIFSSSISVFNQRVSINLQMDTESSYYSHHNKTIPQSENLCTLPSMFNKLASPPRDACNMKTLDSRASFRKDIPRPLPCLM